MTAEPGPYRVALPEFEGPLDLLLHLCKTHEIDIVNIPIAFITEKYLEYLELMQSMPVDVAADYLVMAATLAYLKSRELVPSPEPIEAAGDEEESALDPREELIRRLLEYQKYKDAAEKLGGRPIEGKNVFGRGLAGAPESDGSLAPLAEHSAWKLIEFFGKLLEKSGKKLTHDVVIDRVSISERINQLIDRLESGGGSFRFDSMFDLTQPEQEVRHQVVATLLAILELAKLKVIRVLQAPEGDTLFITHVEGSSLAGARRVVITSADHAPVGEEGEGEGDAGAGEPAAEPEADTLDDVATTEALIEAAGADLLAKAEAVRAELAADAAAAAALSEELAAEVELDAEDAPAPGEVVAPEVVAQSAVLVEASPEHLTPEPGPAASESTPKSAEEELAAASRDELPDGVVAGEEVAVSGDGFTTPRAGLLEGPNEVAAAPEEVATDAAELAAPEEPVAASDQSATPPEEVARAAEELAVEEDARGVIAEPPTPGPAEGEVTAWSDGVAAGDMAGQTGGAGEQAQQETTAERERGDA